MKSSSGAHYIALDHIRAFAAFLVFAWHFGHAGNGYPVPFEFTPSFFPFALLDERHTGVALFMTLSGYLFAKLLDGRTIDFKAFLWNRVLRLVPLLVFVFFVVGIMNLVKGEYMPSYIISLVKGVILPAWPNGGWSITVEFHFYLILPLFLWMFSKSKILPLWLVFAAILSRFLIHQLTGEVQSLAYRTILGRVDQFALGMVVFQFRGLVTRKHLAALAFFLGFTAFYWYFDAIGGFYRNPSYPSPSMIWVFLPTIEALAYAILIAWYETSFEFSTDGISKFVGKIGEYSYSIYLLHFFVVFWFARFINEQIMEISNFYLACGWALIGFLLMVPVSHLSFIFIEAPFLKLRKRYLVELKNEAASAVKAS